MRTTGWQGLEQHLIVTCTRRLLLELNVIVTTGVIGFKLVGET